VIAKFHVMHSLIGHEDWIRGIDVCRTDVNQLLIASCSQDCYIRLWKLSLTNESINDKDVEPVRTDTLAECVDEQDDDVVIDVEIKLKSTLFHLNLDGKQYEFSLGLESVLYGHEDFIYSVRWHPYDWTLEKQPLMLLSGSLDKTIVLWKYDEKNSIWLDIVGEFDKWKTNWFCLINCFFSIKKVRAGDIGGNTLGFYGACFDPAGNYLVAHGFQGALHAWYRVKSDDQVSLTVSVTIGVLFMTDCSIKMSWKIVSNQSELVPS
jgi:elongator complex protein 2